MNRAVAFAPSADVRRFMIMSALSDRRRPRSDTVL